MKRILIVSLLVAACFLGGAYIFIPDTVAIVKATLLPVNKRTAYRCLSDEQLFRIVSEEAVNSATNKDDVRFQLKKSVSGVIEIAITFNASELRSFISFHEPSTDSTGVEWRTDMDMSNHPFRRLMQYRQATRIHKKMSQVLDRLKDLAPKSESVYGMKIVRTVLTDSLLVITKADFIKYPTVEEYYALIKKLRDYIALKKAREVNYPMLNVTAVDSGIYETTVALPVNMALPGNAEISARKMFPGNILTAEVTGGPQQAEQGFVQLANYVADFQLVQPAIYFQSLVTDRLAESDSSKWITKLNYPIY